MGEDRRWATLFAAERFLSLLLHLLCDRVQGGLLLGATNSLFAQSDV